MLLTLILAITATYAWFSTQRDVEVSGMRLNVEVAESLQISLDGEIWTQSIKIANMRQFYGTYTGTGDGFAIYQAKKPDDGGNTNYVPTELLPVSSAGEVANGKLQFVQGTIENNADGTTKLKGITACSENDLTATETVANRQNGNSDHPYLVFDMYLRNISAKTTGLDELLLNAGSAVWVNAGTTDDGEQEGKGVAGTGLEYSARVGMVLYGNTISTTATDTADETIGEQIRGLEADGNEVAAIWEPNHKEHTSYVVSNNGRGITSTTQEVDTYGIKVAVASAATKEIANINSTTDTNLVAVDTFTPPYATPEDGTTAKTVITNTAGNNVGLKPNQISKVRVYIWLEGQDPDCVDLASTGDKLNIDLRLTKNQTTTTDKNTYVGDGTGSGSGVAAGTKLKASEVVASEYGAYVTNYAASTASNEDLGIGGWRIFHDDGTNIYLIADDYVSTEYVPASKNGTEVTTDTEDSYSQGFALLLNGYSGWSDIKDTAVAKWLSQYQASGFAGADVNMAVTAYLLDTTIWAGFKDTNSHADYAIGGAPLELFAASYNVTHGIDIDTKVANQYGYIVKSSEEEWAESITDNYSVEISNSPDQLYAINSDEKASKMWIASPFPGFYLYVYHISYEGGVTGWSYDTTDGGSRPIICLNANTQIEKQADGTYLIVE